MSAPWRILIATSALALLAACGTSAGQNNVSANAPSTTIHAPGYDKTVTAAATKRIVTDYYTAGALADYGITPVGVFGFESDDPAVVGKAKLDGVTVVGKDGELSIEKLAQLQPDLIIGRGNANGTGWTWFKDDVNAQLTKVAPFVPVQTANTVDKTIASYRKLAAELGANVDTPTIRQDDRNLAQAKKDLRAALTGKNLKVMALSPDKDAIYTAVGFAQVDLFADAGATVVGPAKPAKGNPWGTVSWENLSKYPADVYLVHESMNPSLTSQPLWTSQPAVKANQLITWSDKRAYTSSGYAQFLTSAAQQLTKFRTITK